MRRMPSKSICVYSFETFLVKDGKAIENRLPQTSIEKQIQDFWEDTL